VVAVLVALTTIGILRYGGTASSDAAPTAPASAIPVTTEEVTPAPEAGLGDGMHHAGAGLLPGVYRTDGPRSTSFFRTCVYKRLGETSGTVLEKGRAKGPVTVTVEPDDGAFESFGCQPWLKIG
jgi:hypothetical protein